jgi:hypothetical protein
MKKNNSSRRGYTVTTKVIPQWITAGPLRFKRNGLGVDAFYLNVTHAYGWESAVVGLTRPEVKHDP